MCLKHYQWRPVGGECFTPFLLIGAASMFELTGNMTVQRDHLGELRVHPPSGLPVQYCHRRRTFYLHLVGILHLYTLQQ